MMNFHFINEKINKKQSNKKNSSNYYDHNSMKTSSVSQFLTIKKDNLNPSSTTNTLDNSHTKDNDIMKNLIDSKFKPSISKIEKPEIKMKPNRTLKMSISRNTLTQIITLKKLKDTMTTIGINNKKIQICDFTLAFLSIISIFCAIIDNELYIKKTFSYIEKISGFKIDDLINKKHNFNYYIFLLEKRKITPVENFFRCINLISSILCFIILIIKYNYRIIVLKVEKKISEYDNFLSSGIIYLLILECIICLISYPPKINKVFQFSYNTIRYIYSLNNCFLIFNFFKLYNLCRIIILGSRYNSRISETICQTYNAHYNLLFKIKGEINSRPIFFCVIIFIFFIIISTSLLRNFEAFGYDVMRGYIGNKGLNDLRNSMNNIWLNIITITGIGYGDEYPRTNLGRISIFISSIFGMFFLGFLIASISSAIEFNNKENRAFMKMKKIFSKENLEHKSAEFIKALLLLRKNCINYKHKRNRGIILLKERIILIIKLYNDCLNYNDELYVARYYSIPMVNLIRTMEVKLYDSLVLLTKHLTKVDNIDVDLFNLQKDHKSIYETMKNVNYQISKINKFLLENHNNNYLRREEIKKEEEEEELSQNNSSENETSMIKINLFQDPNKTKVEIKDILVKSNTLLSIPKINPPKRFYSPIFNHKQLNKVKTKYDLHSKIIVKTRRNITDTILNKFSLKYNFNIKKVQIRKCKSLIFPNNNRIKLTMVHYNYIEKKLPKSVRKKKNIKFILNC